MADAGPPRFGYWPLTARQALNVRPDRKSYLSHLWGEYLKLPPIVAPVEIPGCRAARRNSFLSFVGQQIAVIIACDLSSRAPLSASPPLLRLFPEPCTGAVSLERAFSTLKP